jgi:hypothetical protein
VVAERILAERPGDAILGEEGGESESRPGSLDRRPADGTISFVYGLAELGEHRGRGGRRVVVTWWRSRGTRGSPPW